MNGARRFVGVEGVGNHFVPRRWCEMDFRNPSFEIPHSKNPSSFPTDQQVLGGLHWWLGFSFEPLVLVEVEGVWKLPGTPPTDANHRFEGG